MFQLVYSCYKAKSQRPPILSAFSTTILNTPNDPLANSRYAILPNSIAPEPGLLNLPSELLQKIFTYLLAEDKPLLIQEDSRNYSRIFYKKSKSTTRDLSLTCLQIYLETTKHHLFYSKNEFKFDTLETTLCWIHRRSHEERQVLTWLSIPYAGLQVPHPLVIFFFWSLRYIRSISTSEILSRKWKLSP